MLDEVLDDYNKFTDNLPIMDIIVNKSIINISIINDGIDQNMLKELEKRIGEYRIYSENDKLIIATSDIDFFKNSYPYIYKVLDKILEHICDCPIASFQIDSLFVKIPITKSTVSISGMNKLCDDFKQDGVLEMGEIPYLKFTLPNKLINDIEELQK